MGLIIWCLDVVPCKEKVNSFSETACHEIIVFVAMIKLSNLLIMTHNLNVYS